MATRRRRYDDSEELNLNKEDVENLKKAVQDEKFRDLLKEYADEVTDPKNVALYQKEISQLEKERGVDITFLQPKPNYVIKTSMNGEKKAFINISSNENIAKPNCEQVNNEGQRGLQWSIPYSLAPEKEDLDKERRYCVVYDALFHPDTLYLATKNNRFKKLVEDTAMDGIEKNFNVKLDRKNIRHPRMKFKGIPIAAVIRKKNDIGPTNNNRDDILSFPPQSKDDKILEKDENPFELKADDVTPKEKMVDDGGKYTKPKYLIKYRNKIELEDFAYQINGAKVIDNCPKEISIEIDLPLISTSANLDLDVTEFKLKLQSENPSYLLELQFSYPINSDSANAKFDSTKRKLFVILPIQNSIRNSINVVEDENLNENLILNNDNEIIDDLSIFNEKIDTRHEIDTQMEFIETLDDDDDELCFDQVYSTPEIFFFFPNYEVKQNENELIFKLDAFNVDPESVIIKTEENEEKWFNIASLQFTSIGTGFVPRYYSFYIKSVGVNKFKGLSDVKVDVGEVNVIFRVGKHENCYGEWGNVELGVDSGRLENVDLVTFNSLVEKLNEWQIEVDGEVKKEVEPIQVDVHEMNESCLKMSVKLGSVKNGDENEAAVEKKVENVAEKVQMVENDKSDKPKTKIISTRRKTRSLSDSDELSPNRKPRSILKTHRYSRSLSESSEDAIGISLDELRKIPTSSDEKIPEESSGDDDSSVRKSVRFNDVVSKNLYRSSASILGQRKKNQRKQKLKKRANQRKTSESEGSESETKAKDEDESEKSDGDGAKSDEGGEIGDEFTQVVRKGKKKRKGNKNLIKNDIKLIEDVTKDEPKNETEKESQKQIETILSWEECEGGIIKVDKVDVGFTNTAIFDLD